MIYAAAEVVFYALAAAASFLVLTATLHRRSQRAPAHERDRVPERLRVRDRRRLRPRPRRRPGGRHPVRLPRDVQGRDHGGSRPGPARGRPPDQTHGAGTNRRHGAVARRRSSTGSATSVPRRPPPWPDSSVSEGPSGSCSRSSPWPRSPTRGCATSSTRPWSWCTSPCPPRLVSVPIGIVVVAGDRAAAILARGQSWVSAHGAGLRHVALLPRSAGLFSWTGCCGSCSEAGSCCSSTSGEAPRRAVGWYRSRAAGRRRCHGESRDRVGPRAGGGRADPRELPAAVGCPARGLRDDRPGHGPRSVDLRLGAAGLPRGPAGRAAPVRRGPGARRDRPATGPRGCGGPARLAGGAPARLPGAGPRRDDRGPAVAHGHPRRLLVGPGRRHRGRSGRDRPGLDRERRNLPGAGGAARVDPSASPGRGRGPRGGRRAVRPDGRGPVPGAPDGRLGGHGADADPVDPVRQPHDGGVDSQAARDDSGEPDGHPARSHRRDTCLPLVRPGEGQGDGGEQARRRRGHRGRPVHRSGAAGRRRRQHQQPVHRRRTCSSADDESTGARRGARPDGRSPTSW